MTTSNYMPDVVVEIAFDSGYATPAASRTWTDVSAYVDLLAGIDIGYGRSDERSVADANSLRLTLDNTDGRFTAGYTGGAYYPNVKIGRPIRVTSTPVGGAASVRFLGYVDEWPTAWPEGGVTHAVATISATSRLARLGADVELRSIVEEEVLLNSPIAYYTMGEAEGATYAADSSGNGEPNLTQVGTGTAVTFGTATGPGTDGLTAATFADGKRLSGELAAGANADFTIIAAINVTTAPASGLGVFLAAPFTNGGGAFITSTSTSQLNIGGWRPGTGGALTSVGDPGTYAIGTTTVVAIAVDAAGTTVSTYQDGVLLGTDTWNTLVPVGDWTTLEVGGYPIPGTSTTIVGATGAVAHVAVFGTELSATQIAAISDSMLNGFAGETPADRIGRYATYAAIPAAEISAETGTSPIAHFDTTGITAVGAMRRVETTDSGVLFDAQDNTLTFHGRAHRYSTASAFTLDAALQQIEADVTPKLDRSAMLNDVTAETTDGTVTARAFDQASIDAYGVARTSIQLDTTDANEPAGAAWWKVNTYAEPSSRIPALGVDLLPLPVARQEDLFAATIGTKFTVSGLPEQAPASSIDFFIEGYTESIGPESYTFSLNVTPTTGFDVFTVEDATYGQYDLYPLAY